MKESLRIEFDRPDRAYRFGEIVRGIVRVDRARSEQCRAIRLVRFWGTHGKGNEERGDPTVTVLHAGPLRDRGPHVFEFEFPAPPGPFTYRGHFLNVEQYVEVQLDLPWARDPRIREEYVLLPGRPFAAPAALLDSPEHEARNIIPGIGAVLGTGALFVGLSMASASQPIGFLFLLGGVVLFLPALKKLSDRRLGEAKAFLSSVFPTPGEEVGVEVKVSPGKLTRLNRALVELTAKERCVSGSGSSRTTHRHEVFSKRWTISGPMTLEGGSTRVLNGSFRVPEDAPPSFRGKSNKLLWEARVRLDIPNWPDWVKRIQLVVWPQENLLGRGERVEAEVDPAPILEEIPAPVLGEEPAPALEEIPGPVLEEIPAPVLEEIPAPVPEGIPAPVLEEIPAPVPEGIPAPPPAPEASGGKLREVDDSLVRALTAIHESDIFDSRKETLIRDLLGKAFEMVIEVKRVDRSMGVFSRADYRDGRTVIGKLLDSDLEVVVLFPGQRDEEVRGWEPGSVHEVRGEVVEWDRLRKLPKLLARD